MIPRPRAPSDEKLIGQVLSDRHSGGKILPGLGGGFKRDLLGWNPSSAEGGKDLGYIFGLHLDADDVAGAGRVGDLVDVQLPGSKRQFFLDDGQFPLGDFSRQARHHGAGRAGFKLSPPRNVDSGQ